MKGSSWQNSSVMYINRRNQENIQTLVVYLTADVYVSVKFAARALCHLTRQAICDQDIRNHSHDLFGSSTNLPRSCRYTGQHKNAYLMPAERGHEAQVKSPV